MRILAASRTLRLGQSEFTTPIVIPSFSSRAKPPTPVATCMEKTLDVIAGPILVSAYDLVHMPPDQQPSLADMLGADAPPFVLLDSGGYEVFWNENAVRAGLIQPGSAPVWSPELHAGLLERWPASVPLLAVSYDEPFELLSLAEQVNRARLLADRFPNHSVELLLKPTANGLDDNEVRAIIPDLTGFPVIGVTEVEIGSSMAERLRFIAFLREALELAGLATPIHVFGGLDPQMTPLFLAAGADIFDGLSWLRYAYTKGLGVYDKAHIAVHWPLETESEQFWEMRRNNARYLVDLQIDLARFAKSRDFQTFEVAGELLQTAWEHCWADALEDRD